MVDDDGLDPIELLRRHDAHPSRSLPGPESPLGRSIYESVMNQAIDADRTHRADRSLRTRPITRVIAAVAVCGLLAAAGWYVTRASNEPRVVGCYQDTSLEADTFVASAPTRIEPAACAALWADGTIINPSIIDPNNVPPLVGCVNDAGGLAVFPADDASVCVALGLTPFEPSTSLDAATELNQRLLELFAASSCLALEDAEDQINGLLGDDRFAPWAVAPAPPAPPDRPCAAFRFNPTTK